MVLAKPTDVDTATPFGTAVRRILLPVVICLSITFVLVVGRGAATAALSARIDGYASVEEHGHRAHEAMLDQETGIRGFLLFGDEALLEPAIDGRIALDAANAELMDAVVTLDDAELAAMLRRLWDAQQRWRYEWADPMREGRIAGDAATLLRGKALFDGYREVSASLNDASEERIAELQRVDRLLLLVGLSIQALLVLTGGLLAMRQVRRLRASVVEPIERLLDGVRRIEDGEYTAALTAEGPMEVRALTQGLAQMAVSLQRGEQERANRERELARQASLQAEVLDLSHEFTARLDVGHVLGALTNGFAQLSGAPTVVVWLFDDARLTVARFAGAEPQRLVCGLGEGLAGRAAVHGSAFAEVDGKVRRAEGQLGAIEALALPLVGGGRTQAVVEVRAAQGAALDVSTTLPVLRTLAAQGGLAMAASQLHQHSVELSRTDALTGVGNRRTFDEDLAAELALARRADRHLAIVMLDIDHFKAVNDAHGHLVGDDTLRVIAGVLGEGLRETDSCYRYGGEEFVLLLRATDSVGASDVAERVREAVERCSASPVPVTVSGGVAELTPATSRPPELLAAADAALYAAKAAGRNRVLVAPPHLGAAAVVD